MFQRNQNTTLISAFLFNARFLWKAIGNFAVFRNRNAHGQLISMHQSGTHYLKHIIACALAHKFGIPDPEFNHANEIFGGPKDPVVYHDVPRLISSHSNPHPALVFGTTHNLFNLPPYVLLVRDIRRSLISNYAKWSHLYNTSFSAYLRGDSLAKKFNSDVWWSIRFLNGWGLIHKRVPTNTMVVKYEELFKEPLKQVTLINDYWNLNLNSPDIEYGVSQSTKSKMALKDDPARPKGAVRKSNNDLSIFTVGDRIFFEKTCAAYLRFGFGYDYSVW